MIPSTLLPSILSAELIDIKPQIRELQAAGIDSLHVDVMDGHFVPNLTFGPMLVKQLRAATDMVLDCHLMISNPDQYIPEFARAGADVITVHAEATTHLDRTLQLIHSHGVKAGVSLNPATSEHVLDYVWDKLDLILVMSVNPGFGGQSFIESSKQKIANISQLIASHQRSIILEVDGGVTHENAAELEALGVNWFVAGSAVFKARDLKTGVQQIHDVLERR